MEESQSRAGALETGLDIIEVLSRSERGLGVSDLASELSMDKGNAHRLLRTLIRRGYVQQDELTKRYRSAATLVSVTGAVLRRLDVRLAADAVCDELVGLTGESVHASQLTSTGPVYVLQRRAPFRVSVETEVGSRPPLHATATGKAVLAYVSQAECESWLTTPLESFTLRTITSLDDLNRELSTVAERGYAIDDEELNPGVRCVAAPVFGIEGDVIGCLGVSGPVPRMDLTRVPQVAEQVVAAARAVTEQLGGPLERHPAVREGILTTAE